MRAVVLQPTYLPWAGYFAMMDQADTFVYYDDVQFSKQSWQQRNRIRSIDNDCIWLTVPIKKGPSKKIHEVQIDNSSLWSKRHWRTIEVAYCKAPYFKSYSDPIKEIFKRVWTSLADLNIYTIELLANLLRIRMPKIIRSSELMGLDGVKEERLINLLQMIHATEYISGPSAKDYIVPSDFADNNIMLHWFEFTHPVYSQYHGEFIPFLSSLDMLFNEGDRSIEYIREGSINAMR